MECSPSLSPCPSLCGTFSLSPPPPPRGHILPDPTFNESKPAFCWAGRKGSRQGTWPGKEEEAFRSLRVSVRLHFRSHCAVTCSFLGYLTPSWLLLPETSVCRCLSLVCSCLENSLINTHLTSHFPKVVSAVLSSSISFLLVSFSLPPTACHFLEFGEGMERSR